MYLNVPTTFNLLKSTIRVEDLIGFLKEQRISGCAVTNEEMYNVKGFQEKFEKAGLQPVYALRVTLDAMQYGELPLFVYARNKEGFNNLMKLSSAAMTQVNKKVKLSWLTSYKEGLYAVIPFLTNHWVNQQPMIERLKIEFTNSLFIGIARTNGRKYESESQAVAYATHFQLPIVALHESYYLRKEDALAYDVLRAIDYGVPLKQLQPTTTEYYLPTVEEMKQWFADVPQWLNNANSLLLNCKVTFPPYKAHMPEYPLESGENQADVLKRLAYAGLQVRLQGKVTADYVFPSAYKERLDYELSVINSMGYASYFLIVADYMAFARRSGILTGPGRGSSASSLVAYALQITNVDPLQYGLLFERFLNPSRISLPDIDIDFIDSRRHEILQYLVSKYGKNHVAQIVTFGNLTAKAVGRDVGRMLGFDNKKLKEISTLLTRTRKETLQEAYDCSTTFQKFVNAEKINQIWFSIALQLEGIPRNTSTHAAGVVLTPTPLINYVPLKEGNEGAYSTQWEMTEVENEGILKVDLLGLRNLGILQSVLLSMEKTYRVMPTLETIPLNDEATFKLLQEGHVEGIFQLESDSMREALVSIRPTTINDIIAVNALNRPGPMAFIKDYAARKNGQATFTYQHPSLQPILEETYGIIIYQEQILKIAQTFAGMSIAEADLLRRAISKKKREILEEQGAIFVQGAVQQGNSKEVAEDIYSLIVKFAEYGFAKSHSTAYSLITYQMAFLKANYPSHYYAVLLNDAAGNEAKTNRIIAEMKKRGMAILPIDIEQSEFLNKSENKAVRLGFKMIKGLSEVKVQQHQIKNVDNLFTYAEHVSEAFDKEVVEKLIKAGAFDQLFSATRATLLASLETAAYKAQERDTLDLGDSTAVYSIAKTTKSNYEYEMEVLGFSLEAHPIFEKRTADYSNTFDSLTAGSTVNVMGKIDAIKNLTTKKLEDMAILTCSDETGTTSITVFPREYKTVELKLNDLIAVSGKVEERYGKKQIVANKIRSIK